MGPLELFEGETFFFQRLDLVAINLQRGGPQPLRRIERRLCLGGFA